MKIVMNVFRASMVVNELTQFEAAGIPEELTLAEVIQMDQGLELMAVKYPNIRTIQTARAKIAALMTLAHATYEGERDAG